MTPPPPNPLPPPPPVRQRRRALAVAALGRRRRPALRRRRSVALLTAALLAGTVLAVAGLRLGVALIPARAGVLTTPRPLPADSIVTDAGGTVIADLHPPGQTRLPVPLDAVAPVARTAIVDVEDKGFWTEGPVDVGRLVASAVHDLRGGGAPQGGSTIPMQLAKVLYVTDDRSIDYKIRQIAVAGRLLARWDRSTILAAYLNDIFFGEGATGIQAAAHVYFGIDAAHLDLAQAAMLAGIPNAPSSDDPRRHPAAAAARQRTVLAAMVAQGHITAAQAAAAAAEHLQLAGSNIDNVDTQPAFVARVVSQVQSQLHRDPLRDGLRIGTALQPSLQAFAETTVRSQVAAVRRLNVNDGALVSVNPQTGAVVAYVGSAGLDAASTQIDMAARPRQPGSTFKLFTYAAALDARMISMVTPVYDGPLRLPTGGGANGTQSWSPLDYDRRWHGVLPVAQAFPNSLNVPAVRTEMLVGVPQVLGMARRLGVTTLSRPDQFYGQSLTLGTYDVPLTEMAQAAAAFADSGRLHPVTFVTSVIDGDGRQIHHPAATSQAVDPGTAFIINQMLTDDRNRWLEFGAGSDLTLPGHLVSAKTGTSEDFKDNLTVGWTPQLVTATWVGNADDSAMRGTTGITGAAPIWNAVMAHALQGVDDAWPAMPADVSAQQSGAYDPAYFLSGTDASTGASALLGDAAAGWWWSGGDNGDGDNGNGGAWWGALIPSGKHGHH